MSGLLGGQTGTPAPRLWRPAAHREDGFGSGAGPRPPALLASEQSRAGTTWPAGQGWDALTPRELQVVALVTLGATNRQTARRLRLSPHTVNAHLRHVFTKLGVSSRVELTRVAVAREQDGPPHRPAGSPSDGGLMPVPRPSVDARRNSAGR